MFDAAHIAGLIAGGAHPNPVPCADIVTFTTHKTLRGPRGGCILSHGRARRGHRQGGVPGPPGRPARPRRSRPRRSRFHEAAAARVQATTPRRSWPTPRPSPRASPAQGFRLVSGGTDNHLMLVDLRTFDAELSGKKARLALDRAGITLNKNTIPDDPRPPYITSGLRIGTPAVTTQGMGPDRDGRRSPSSSHRRARRPTPTRRRSPPSAPRCAPSARSSRRTRLTCARVASVAADRGAADRRGSGAP